MKWEYLCEVPKINNTGKTVEWLNTLGMEGWELVCVAVFNSNCEVFYFKRPAQGETNVQGNRRAETELARRWQS